MASMSSSAAVAAASTVKVSHLPAVEETLQCMFCYEQLTRPVVDECGHSFDDACLTAYAKKAAEAGKTLLCPISKKPLDMKKVQPNYKLAELIGILNQQSSAASAGSPAPSVVRSVPNSSALMMMQMQYQFDQAMRANMAVIEAMRDMATTLNRNVILLNAKVEILTGDVAFLKAKNKELENQLDDQKRKLLSMTPCQHAQLMLAQTFGGDFNL